MRKILRSGNRASRVALSARAEARSRPKGFYTITRAPCAPPVDPRCSMTTGNTLGGMAR